MIPTQLQLALVPEPAAVGRARRALAPCLVAWGLPAPLRDDLLLVLSELVTNAVRHALDDRDLALTVVCLDDELVVTVRDHVPALPVQRRAAPDAESGRGMTLVAAVSSRWWVERTPGGKCVSVALTRRTADEAVRAS
ncbi:MAG: ATP-binding protein [Actinomycetota bacterium]|jgi:serine/threonine-protein kinase RsbW|nr:ATP-binding protein [Actinomycetota bacterium]